MRVKLRLIFADSEGKVSTSRQAFWQEYGSRSRTHRSPIEPDDAERLLIRKFGDVITEYFRHGPRSPVEAREKARSPDEAAAKEAPPSSTFFPFRHWLRSPSLRVELLAIRYGSIEFLLGLFGIDNESTKQLAFEMLSFYSPMAFNEVLGGHVDFTAEVLALETPNAPANGNALTPARLALMSTSLLVPFLMALGVCYVVFNAMTEELKGVRSERMAAKAELSDMLKATVDQNAKISASLLEIAKGSAASTKELEDLQLNIIKLRAQSLGLLPNNAPSDTRPAGAPSGTSETK
jgi:hypothetical protein